MRRGRKHKGMEKERETLRLVIMIKKEDVKSQICHGDGR